MGKRPGTVRVLTHRGLRRLAEQLGADSSAYARRVM
jgi:DNA-directed RNA polymerase specialized sigma24 family protein